MIRIRYFARLSESLGLRSEELGYRAEFASAKDIIDHLMARGDPWAGEFGGDNRILIAVNQEMAEPGAAVKDGDEIGFFPPVTGG